LIQKEFQVSWQLPGRLTITLTDCNNNFNSSLSLILLRQQELKLDEIGNFTTDLSRTSSQGVLDSSYQNRDVIGSVLDDEDERPVY